MHGTHILLESAQLLESSNIGLSTLSAVGFGCGITLRDQTSDKIFIYFVAKSSHVVPVAGVKLTFEIADGVCGVCSTGQLSTNVHPRIEFDLSLDQSTGAPSRSRSPRPPRKSRRVFRSFDSHQSVSISISNRSSISR